MSEQMMEELDIPRLLRKEENYCDPNVPLPLDREHLLQLTANHFVSERTLVLGQTGMGKGNAGALITEFLLEAGLPLTFVDLEGEGYSFKEMCSSLLVVGRSAHADREYAPSQMGRLAELSVEQGFSVVLDLSGYTDEEIFALVAPYLQSIWATCERLRTPYHLILDEAHELVPEEGTTPVKALLRRIAKRGRKRGLGVVAMSQETASLDKKFLRQMAIRILLPVTYEADLKIYHTLIPGVPLDTLKNTMPAFSPGTGYVVFNHHPYLVHLLRRRTFDPSETPKLGDQRVTPTLHTMDQQTLQRIDQALPSESNGVLEGLDRATLIQLVRELRHLQSEDQELLEVRDGSSDGVLKLKKQVRDAESMIQEQRGIISRQQEQIELLSRLSVHVDGISMQVPTPSTLTVEQATVQHMSVPTQTFSGMITHTVEAAADLKVVDQSLPLNEAKFASLQKRLRQVPQLEREVLRVLVEQGKSLTSQDIAAWLNRAESTIQNHPPQVLLKLGLVSRSREKRGYVYHAKLAEYLRREFPGVDVQQLQSRLIHS